MAKKRSKFFETKRFGFVIAALIAGIVLALSYGTSLLDVISLKTIDSFFRIKQSIQPKAIQEGSTYAERNMRVSEDILIVGIDYNTLAKYGKWPFPRSHHADLVNTFSRIKDQTNRESAIFLDVLFGDPGDVPEDDLKLEKAMADSGRVFIETFLDPQPLEGSAAEAADARSAALYAKFGTIKRVSGPWQNMVAYLGAEPPLQGYIDAGANYGHPNFLPDTDQVFRRVPIIAKTPVLLGTLRFDELRPGFTVDEASFERLAWLDAAGFYHSITTPITEKSLAALRRELEQGAPKKIEDTNGDGTPDTEYFVIRKFQDRFLPSVGLSLALNYFGKTLDDVEVILGEHVLIDAPTRFNPETGERVPYEIIESPDIYDEAGTLVTAGKRRPVPFLEIPIDDNGWMMINYMGPPSSDSAEGYQTYPVRSFAGYADRAPPEDQAAWRRTQAVPNKIIMMGAFAKGLADEKLTPYGLMNGIEIHANALNTILMGAFLRNAPAWMNYLALGLLVFLVAFMTSRLSTVLSFFSTLFLELAWFLGAAFAFELKDTILLYAPPAVAMLLAFIAIVVYRQMTEEKEKKAIRETFGKYLSKEVVDQLVDNPPELGGVDKELTVLFSDIRGFTTLSENMDSPQKLVNHLNAYLGAMTDVIMEYNGYLDKYVGDEVMCFWGAPMPQADHAVLACKCAIRQMQRLHELNEGWPEALRINIGIGLNSGIMTVGNMGSPVRMNYTLMGDNVNLGARLEGTNKEYGTNIIISENTYSLVKDKFIVRELDNIRVKGKNKPVVIYELVDCLEDLAPNPGAPAKALGKGK